MRKPEIRKNIVYHIYNRGVSKRRIFKDDQDYRFFIYRILYYKKKYNIELISYCVMPNHFHLLVKSPYKDNCIASFMKSLQLSYAHYFNSRCKHSGHVFEGSYKNKEVNTQTYLAKIISYIAMNPVRKKFVKSPEDWPYAG